MITAYLNEIFYGHGAYGVAAAASIYFGISDLSKLTPAQAALLAGAAPVAHPLRPLPPRQGEREGRAGRGEGRADHRPAQLHPREPLHEPLDEAHAGTAQEGARGAGHARGRQAEHLPGRPLHVAGEEGADPDLRQRGGGRDRRLHRDHHARLERAEARREVGHGRRRAAEHRVGSRLRRGPQAAQDRARGPALDRTRCATRTSTTARSSRSTIGPATCSRTSAAPGIRATTCAAPSSTPSSTSCPTASASRLGVEADPLRHGVRSEEAHAGLGAARHHDRVRQGQPDRQAVGAARRRQPRPRARARAQGAPVLAQPARDPRPRARRQRGGRGQVRGVRHPTSRAATCNSSRAGWRGRSGRSR